MKWLMVILLSLPSRLPAQVFRFSIFDYAFHKNGVTDDKPNWIKLDRVLTMDTAKKSLLIQCEVDSCEISEYKLLKMTGNWSTVAGDSRSDYDGRDILGHVCKVEITVFHDHTKKHIATLIISSPDGLYVYRLRRLGG